MITLHVIAALAVCVHGERQPTEVVINKVEKNEVAVYVSFPKTTQQTLSSGGGQ